MHIDKHWFSHSDNHEILDTRNSKIAIQYWKIIAEGSPKYVKSIKKSFQNSLNYINR